MGEIETFLRHIEATASWFKERAPREVIVFHHNDSDGLSSGAILFAALERLGISARGYCLEKPYPRVLEMVFGDPELSPDTVFIFADFASGMLDTISRLNKGGNDILLLDHHSIFGNIALPIRLLNCRGFNVSGNSECTASTICYFFARSLSGLNRDLSRLALIGIYGDRHFNGDGKILGLNAIAAEDAAAEGYFDADAGTVTLGEPRPALELRAEVDALGSFGYLDGGPDVAIKGLLEGFDDRYRDRAQKLRSEFDAAMEDFLDGAELRETQDIQWFILPESFSGMGVKTVGLVCEALLDRGVADRQKYLAGFQRIPNRVPGLGEFEFGEYKISMRISPELREQVIADECPGLDDLLPPAASAAGGFVDACHQQAAAATVAVGKEQELIDLMQTAL